MVVPESEDVPRATKVSPPEALLFVTLTFVMDWVPSAFKVSFGILPAPVSLIIIGLAAVPVRVRLFVTIWVVPWVNVRILPAVVEFKL